MTIRPVSIDSEREVWDDFPHFFSLPMTFLRPKGSLRLCYSISILCALLIVYETFPKCPEALLAIVDGTFTPLSALSTFHRSLLSNSLRMQPVAWERALKWVLRVPKKLTTSSGAWSGGKNLLHLSSCHNNSQQSLSFRLIARTKISLILFQAFSAASHLA